MGAWEMVNLSRFKRLPKLQTLLRKSGERNHQTPEQQEVILRDIAAEFGLKVERHEHPVL
jgi:hypothetical protein